MSATAAFGATGSPDPTAQDAAQPPWKARALTAMVVGLNVALIGLGLATHRMALDTSKGIVTWIVLVAVAGFLPISSGEGVFLSLDLPLLLAAAFIYGPVSSGLIAFAGTTYPNEWRGRVSVSRLLFNRSQVSLSTMAAALAFQLAGGRLGVWPSAALAGLLGLFADSLVNYSIVALFATLSMGRPFFTVIRTMRFGSPSTFVPSYIAFGFLGVLIAEMYLRLGFVAIVGFLAPVFMVRQMFLYGHRLESVTRALASRNNALRRVDERIAEERRDERSRIAAALHDDVLQSLYGVTLRAQVIKEDLRTGRLLDLDADLPDLLHAGETAVEGLRDVIRDLRRSTIGHAGLIDTLTLLIEHLQGETGIRFVASLDIGCRADADVELGIYQIAREALTNAVKHSQADSIQVSLKQDESDIVLVVEDDGTGFSPASQHDERHFGLELMKERARVLGGAVGCDPPLGSELL